jgi:hypothetical protein
MRFLFTACVFTLATVSMGCGNGSATPSGKRPGADTAHVTSADSSYEDHEWFQKHLGRWVVGYVEESTDLYTRARNDYVKAAAKHWALKQALLKEPWLAGAVENAADEVGGINWRLEIEMFPRRQQIHTMRGRTFLYVDTDYIETKLFLLTIDHATAKAAGKSETARNLEAEIEGWKQLRTVVGSFYNVTLPLGMDNPFPLSELDWNKRPDELSLMVFKWQCEKFVMLSQRHLVVSDRVILGPGQLARLKADYASANKEVRERAYWLWSACKTNHTALEWSRTGGASALKSKLDEAEAAYLMARSPDDTLATMGRLKGLEKVVEYIAKPSFAER